MKFIFPIVFQEAEAKRTDLVGKKAESLEPGWSFLGLGEEKPVNTNNKASVTKPIIQKKPADNLKLEISAAQFLNEFTLDTPEVDLLKISLTPNSTKAEEEVVSSTNSEVEMVFIDNDCVENEEVVETSEYVDRMPKIVLTESADPPEMEDVELCKDLLTPSDFMEECTSDHGYESYDSPISEPDELARLFPELW